MRKTFKKTENKELLLDYTDLASIMTANEEIKSWIWKKLFMSLNELNKNHNEENKTLKITLKIGKNIYEANFSKEKYPEEIYNLK